DKTKRTIVAVAEGAQAPRALNITADDADMFGVITVSSRWLRQQWPELVRDRKLSTSFSSWDDGDALTHCNLGRQPSACTVDGELSFDEKPASEKTRLFVRLIRLEGASSVASSFAAPDGFYYQGTAWSRVNGTSQPISVIFADVQTE